MPRAKKAVSPDVAQAEVLRQRLAKSVAKGAPLTIRQARFLRTGVLEKHLTVRMRAEEWRYVHGVAVELGFTMQRLWEDGLNHILREHGKKPIVGFSGDKPE